MVVCIVKLIPLVKEGGVEDKVHFLFDEPRYMSVRQLCRITFRFAGNGFDAKLVNFAVGNRGEHHPEPKLCEEGEPERIILVHIQHPRNTHSAPLRLVGGQRFIGKVAFQLIVKEIGGAVFLFGPPKPPLATVAGNVLTPTRKFIDGKTTVVGAPFTFGHTGLVLQPGDLFQIQHGSLISLFVVRPCN